MSLYPKTAAVARLLGVRYSRVYRLVHDGKMAPAKDDSGDYVWSPANVRQARRLLGLEAVPSNGKGGY